MQEIVEYIRERRHGRLYKTGVLLGWSTAGNPIHIGWSKVMTRKDVFNRDRGLEIARGRKLGYGKTVTVPHVVIKQLPAFKERCLKYFKGAELSPYASQLGVESVVSS